MIVLVDTGAWYAVYDQGDRHHQEASGAYAELLRDHDLTTTSPILVETWLLLCSRMRRGNALQFWSTLRDAEVPVLNPLDDDIEQAWSIIAEFDDQDFSFTDATSFAMMVRLGITHAFAFDQHFRTFRYGPRRNRRFTIIP